MRTLPTAYRTLMVKFALCSAIGLGISAAIGMGSSPTAAVTAVLITYAERGKSGTLSYSIKRVATQVVMGAVAASLVYLLHTLLLMTEVLTSILAATIGMPVGVLLDHRFHIAPLPATLGCSVLIMSTGISGDYKFYCQRVISCVIGVAVAYAVNGLTAKMQNIIVQFPQP